MMMAASGNSLQMALVASTPPMPGSFKSISTMSGRCLRKMFNGLRAGGGFGFNDHVRLDVDRTGKTHADDEMIVHDHDAYLFFHW